jgi:uncharacterized protein
MSPPRPPAGEVRDARARELIAQLRLEPHPEGGYFREVYRSAFRLVPGDGRTERAALTTIHFLLAAGQQSRWHRVRSDEVWQFCDGDPLELFVGPPDLGRIDRVVLGPAGSAGELVCAVPPGWWQAARPLGRYSLVGCTVAPGFEFADFAFLRDDSGAAALLARVAPGLSGLV